MVNFPELIINRVKKTIKKKKALVHEPFFTIQEKKYLNDCINSSLVSTIGSLNTKSYCYKFEMSLKAITKSKYVILTNSGSSAIHISFLVSNIKKNDEILLPSLSYISNANSILLCGGIPHFVEICEQSLSVDLKKLEKYLSIIAFLKKGFLYNKKTRNRIFGLQILYPYGMPSNIEQIKKFTKKYNLFFFEDSAEALGSYFNGKHVGTFGDIGILSFNGNKIVTTGMGGAILTNSKKIYNKASHISQLSKKKHLWKYEYDNIGFNYRMANVNAALGLAQIKKLKIFLSLKRSLFQRYKKNFSSINSKVKLFEEPAFCKSNYWLNTLILNKKYKKFRNEILRLSNQQGIGMRGPWQLLHTVKHLKSYPKMSLKVTEDLGQRIINIPSSAHL
jgi:perosamine synthetase